MQLAIDSDVLTPPEVARILRVDPKKITNWIESGQLKAANVGVGTIKPRWRISRTDLEEFLASRSSRPLVQRKKKARRK